jgi:uncharacterized protein
VSDPFIFDFAGEIWRATPEGALFWPRRHVLLVADLHLEKASWFATHGQPLPPYDSRATMAALAAVAERVSPAEIWCLGDSFHDHGGQWRLDPAAENILRSLADELVLDGLVFRHEHDPRDPRPQLSGHFHPKTMVPLRGRNVRRGCFACGDRALILPAFGSLTGGLDIDDPAIAGLFDGPFAALVPTAQGLARFSRAFVAKMSHISD